MFLEQVRERFVGNVLKAAARVVHDNLDGFPSLIIELNALADQVLELSRRPNVFRRTLYHKRTLAALPAIAFDAAEQSLCDLGRRSIAAVTVADVIKDKKVGRPFASEGFALYRIS